MKTWLLAAAMAFAPLPAFAQPAPAAAPTAASEPAAPQAATAPAAAPARPAAAPVPDANPALWVVRDADTTIYLFGTFHLLDGRPWFNDEVRAAFDESNELVLEAILPENVATLQPMILRYAVDPQGRKLSDRLTPPENAAVGRTLAHLGAPANALDMMEPWFVSMTLTVASAQTLGIDAANGPETLLSRAARERHMPVGELEGMEWQLRMLDTMPEEQQLTQLRETLHEIDHVPELLAPMLAAWSRGDVDGLQRITDAQGDDDPALHRLLFTTRNATWAQWIQERLARPGIVFIAVGAGHLSGRDSVLAVLREHGIRARRVPHVTRP